MRILEEQDVRKHITAGAIDRTTLKKVVRQIVEDEPDPNAKVVAALERLIAASKKSPDNSKMLADGLTLIVAHLNAVSAGIEGVKAAMAPKPKKKWKFSVKRNSDHLIESIEATQG
jgi:hypothetical protein